MLPDGRLFSTRARTFSHLAGRGPARQRCSARTKIACRLIFRSCSKGLMPYLHLDLPGIYATAVKRDLATRLCKLYAEVMENSVVAAKTSVPLN